MVNSKDAKLAVETLQGKSYLGREVRVDFVCRFILLKSEYMIIVQLWQAKRERARTPTPGRYLGNRKQGWFFITALFIVISHPQMFNFRCAVER
jgi:hypothetical protein